MQAGRRATGSVLLALALASAMARAATPEPGAPRDETFLSVDSPIGAIEYVAGRGLSLGRTGITLGGFSTLEIDREAGEPGTIQLDSANLLVLFQPVDALRGFAEIEFGDLLEIETDHGDAESEPVIDVERLYGDLSRNDALNLRFGKFQTPVGRWNLAPAEPFVWTATDPVLVERAFDEHQTGAALFGSIPVAARPLTWWVYGQLLDPLDAPRDSVPIDRSAGGRLEYGGPLGSWSLGASLLASERNGDWNLLGGVDALWRIGSLELQGELVAVDGRIPRRNLWGIYLQGVYELGRAIEPLRSLYLVGRYERFDPSGWSEASHVGDVGLTWLPARYLNVKLGYRFASDQTVDVRRGLFGSLSVLF